jgi:hypothetical protein
MGEQLSRDRHIAWPYLPELAARLYVGRALTSLQAPLHMYDGDPQALAVLEKLPDKLVWARASDTEFRVPDVGENADYAPLDTSLIAVADGLKRSEAHRGLDSTMAAEVLSAIEAALRNEPCRSCCDGHGVRICKWTESTTETDKRTLRDRGRCLDPATHMFEFALALAAEAYEPLVLANAPLIAVHFKTERLPALNKDLDAFVAGWTKEDLSEAVYHRFVSARILEQEFLPADYMVMLYVLVHECIAHAYCGVTVDGEGSDDSIAFHEGWMDEVAALVLDDALRSEIDDALDGQAGRYGSQFLAAMDGARSIRHKYKRRGAPIDAPIWIEGVGAFEAVRLAFEDIVERNSGRAQRSLAQELLVDLSLAINRSEVDHERRGIFVAKLAKYYIRDTPHLRRQARLLRPELDRAIALFLVDRNALTFLDRVVSIP